MESKPDGRPNQTSKVEAQALLNTLDHAKGAAIGESLWPQNPLWHGPLLAVMIWGILAFSWGPTTTVGLLGLAGGLIGFYFTGYRYWRLRKARGVRPTGTVVGRLITMYAFTTLVTLAVIIGWGQTVYRFGEPSPGIATIIFGLIISSAIVTGGVSITNALSRTWLGTAA